MYALAIEFDRIKRRLAKTLKVSWTLVDGDIELLSFAGNSGNLLYSPLFDRCNFQEARFTLDPLTGFDSSLPPSLSSSSKDVVSTLELLFMERWRSTRSPFAIFRLKFYGLQQINETANVAPAILFAIYGIGSSTREMRAYWIEVQESKE
uniref:Uncharacterized protein n=1 Tax=Glossina pallidipes TaxID=7398 RepID=A0A1A9Z583_GLOPL